MKTILLSDCCGAAHYKVSVQWPEARAFQQCEKCLKECGVQEYVPKVTCYHIVIDERYWPMKFRDWNDLTDEERTFRVKEEVQQFDRALRKEKGTTIATVKIYDLLTDEARHLVSVKELNGASPDTTVVMSDLRTPTKAEFVRIALEAFKVMPPMLNSGNSAKRVFEVTYDKHAMGAQPSPAMDNNTQNNTTT